MLTRSSAHKEALATGRPNDLCGQRGFPLDGVILCSGARGNPLADGLGSLHQCMKLGDGRSVKRAIQTVKCQGSWIGQVRTKNGSYPSIS